MRLHVIHCVDGEALVPFVPLIRFFVERGVGSRLSYQRSHVASVMLLLDHLASQGVAIENAEETALQKFVDDLAIGTIADDGHDPSGLYWRPISMESVASHLSRVTAFSDWLVKRMGNRPLNPWRAASAEEKIFALRRFDHRANAALLSHAAYRRNEARATNVARVVKAPRPAATFDDVRALSADGFKRLIEKGWARPASQGASLARRYRLRDLLICILLHGGGLRVSEAFHLFAGDVQPDPDQPGHALVWLFHPERGEAPDEVGGPWRDRQHYLADRWKRRPRTQEVSRFKAGWKNLALTDNRRQATRVWWYPSFWGQVFWRLFGAYLRARPEGRHPFLFVSERKGERGDPYTIAAFAQAHRRAVSRAGLVAGKNNGTTPHAHRHAFGLSLADASFDRRVVQRALHHRNPFSQDIYKSVSATRVADSLRDASQRIEQGAPHFDFDSEF